MGRFETKYVIDNPYATNDPTFTSRLVADPETSADEFALEDDEMSTSFSKRVRKGTPDYDRGKARRGCALGSGISQSTNPDQRDINGPLDV